MKYIFVKIQEIMNLKRLAILTIVLHFFIIVGFAHGIACIGLLEIFGIPTFFGMGAEDFSFSLIAEYEKSLGASALFALVGHIILITSMYIKSNNKKYRTRITGVVFLLVSFYYVAHNLFTDDAALIGFFSGLPFAICSVILLYRLKKEKSIFLNRNEV